MTDKIVNILDDLVEMVSRVADSLENLVFLKNIENFEFGLESRNDYSFWTVKELKEELMIHGMPTYGLKADLIERLEEEFE